MCKIEAKVSQNGVNMGATNRQHFENTRKRASKNRCEKRVLNRNATKPFEYRPRFARGLILGPAGEGFREGVGWFLLGSRVVLV